jgi:hypothetical protein
MKEDVVVCLALSGGGSRAAWFSSAVMFELAKIETDPDLLAQVDVISSVSGGSLAAAYFAASKDPAPRALLSAPPRAALPQCADAKLEYDAKTRLLTVKGAMTDDEGRKLHAACDPNDVKRIDRLVVASRGCVSDRDWDHDSVRELMTRDYVRRLFWNFFWPQNVALYWTTAYDRGDIMAETFADNLFDRKKFGTSYGTSLTFADLNPVRPSLILNSTDGTDDPKPVDAEGRPREQGRGFGDVFAFTRETFADELHSDLSKFPLAYAVMSSASFPGAFPYRTMRDFRVKPPHDPAYVHVFDGGNSDNLGLSSIKEVIKKHEEEHGAGKTTYIVICVDSYTEPRGARPRDADPRDAVDYVVDTDFLDAIDMLLKLNRYQPARDVHVGAAAGPAHGEGRWPTREGGSPAACAACRTTRSRSRSRPSMCPRRAVRPRIPSGSPTTSATTRLLAPHLPRPLRPRRAPRALAQPSTRSRPTSRSTTSRRMTSRRRRSCSWSAIPRWWRGSGASSRRADGPGPSRRVLRPERRVRLRDCRRNFPRDARGLELRRDRPRPRRARRRRARAGSAEAGVRGMDRLEAGRSSRRRAARPSRRSPTARSPSPARAPRRTSTASSSSATSRP